jgi:hypothetical protein
VLLSFELLWGIAPWFGFHPLRVLGSAQPLDLIVVLDGGSSRLAAAARLRQSSFMVIPSEVQGTNLISC